MMKSVQVWGSLVLGVSVSAAIGVQAEGATEIPPVVPGAQPVTVEHSKIHGKSLEGNLERDAVDRDIIVFLPPSYTKLKSKRYPVVYPCTVTP